MNELNPKNQNLGSSNWAMASLAFEMGFIIALPAVAMALLGKYLDREWGTEPWMTVSGIGLALLISTTWLVRRLKEYIKK